MVNAPAENTVPIDASALIDSQPISKAQMGIFFLVFLIAAFDGLDTQVISYLALEIAGEWNISRAVLSSVFSIGLFGIMLGSLSLASLGDMLGQKRVLVVMTLCIGISTIGCGFATSIDELLIYRFLTGFFVGGALPNTVALISQFAPARRRAGLIAIVSVGLSLGGATGGVLTALLLADYGWRVIFYTAGSMAVVLTPFLFFFLSDPIPALLKRPDGQKRANDLLRRFFPGHVKPEVLVTWSDPSHGEKKLPLAVLFQPGRMGVTLFISVAFALSLMNVYLLLNWLPALLQDAQVPAQQAVIASTGFHLAGMIGSLVIGWSIDRFGFGRALVGSYLVASVAITVLALNGFGFAALVLAAFVTGFFVIGSQGALNSLPSILYPAAVRSTATGWGLGIGRLGSISGPILAGVLLTAGWTHVHILLIGALVALLSAIVLLGLAGWVKGTVRKV